MSKSVNAVTLLGNVGKDPEVKFLPSGQAVANLSLATTYRVKDRDSDDWKEMTDWHHVVAFGRPAEILRDYVKKGHRLYVEGRLTTRSWDDKDTGKKVYRTETVVNDLILLTGRGAEATEAVAETAGTAGGSRNQTAGRGTSSQGPRNTGSRASQPQSRASSVDEYYESQAEISDDDIPF